MPPSYPSQPHNTPTEGKHRLIINVSHHRHPPPIALIKEDPEREANFLFIRDFATSQSPEPLHLQNRRMATHRCRGELSGGRGWFRWLFDEERKRRGKRREGLGKFFVRDGKRSQVI